VDDERSGCGDSLEVIESTLVDFNGTVLVVSHDRTFLDNAATSTIAFTGDNEIHEYVGGNTDYLRQRPQPQGGTAPLRTVPAAKPRARTRKLSNKERAELEALPELIDTLESEKSALHEKLSNPSIYQNGEDIPALKKRLDAIDQELDAALERWEILDLNHPDIGPVKISFATPPNSRSNDVVLSNSKPQKGGRYGTNDTGHRTGNRRGVYLGVPVLGSQPTSLCFVETVHRR
jgi:ATPase subunit of ABC transporter with duplicated ATPase domains